VIGPVLRAVAVHDDEQLTRSAPAKVGGTCFFRENVCDWDCVLFPPKKVCKGFGRKMGLLPSLRSDEAYGGGTVAAVGPFPDAGSMRQRRRQRQRRRHLPREDSLRGKAFPDCAHSLLYSDDDIEQDRRLAIRHGRGGGRGKRQRDRQRQRRRRRRDTVILLQRRRRPTFLLKSSQLEKDEMQPGKT